mmetsp:Transcript_82551/g.242214  ORF Transcript_82551/g.242214 Transcript_82551/m.242214 type:complete len:476 (-) Transcript_82551:549-1976(-)
MLEPLREDVHLRHNAERVAHRPRVAELLADLHSLLRCGRGLRDLLPPGPELVACPPLLRLRLLGLLHQREGPVLSSQEPHTGFHGLVAVPYHVHPRPVRRVHGPPMLATRTPELRDLHERTAYALFVLDILGDDLCILCGGHSLVHTIQLELHLRHQEQGAGLSLRVPVAAEELPSGLGLPQGLLDIPLCEHRAGELLERGTLCLQVLPAHLLHCQLRSGRSLLKFLPAHVERVQQGHDPGLALLVLEVPGQLQRPLRGLQGLQGAGRHLEVLRAVRVARKVALARQQQGLHLHLLVQGDLRAHQELLRHLQGLLAVAARDVRLHQRLRGRGLHLPTVARLLQQPQRVLCRNHRLLRVLLLEVPQGQELSLLRLQEDVPGQAEEVLGLAGRFHGVLIHLLQAEGYPYPVQRLSLAALLPEALEERLGLPRHLQDLLPLLVGRTPPLGVDGHLRKQRRALQVRLLEAPEDAPGLPC